MGSRRRDNRRDISMRGITYARLKAHCQNTGDSISGTVEGWLTEGLDALEVPVPTSVDPRPSEEPEEPTEPMGGVHFF